MARKAASSVSLKSAAWRLLSSRSIPSLSEWTSFWANSSRIEDGTAGSRVQTMLFATAAEHSRLGMTFVTGVEVVGTVGVGVVGVVGTVGVGAVGVVGWVQPPG